MPGNDLFHRLLLVVLPIALALIGTGIREGPGRTAQLQGLATPRVITCCLLCGRTAPRFTFTAGWVRSHADGFPKRAEVEVTELIPPPGLSARNSSALREHIRARLGAVRACYESRVDARPSLAGTMNVEFMVGLDGMVSVLGISATDMRDQPLERCLLGAFPTWTLPERSEFFLPQYSFAFSSR